MKIIQEMVDLNTGRNFRPSLLRYKLPNENSVSVFLLSNSYEYDIELLKSLPESSSSIHYKTIMYPAEKSIKFGINTFDFKMEKSAISREVEYFKNKKLPLNIKFKRLAMDMNTNMFIPLTEIYTRFNGFIRNSNNVYIKENIVSMFTTFFNNVASAGKMNKKIIVIDTQRFKIEKHLSDPLYGVDLINALLTTCLLYPKKIEEKRDWNTILLFKSPKGDYRLNLDVFNGENDNASLKAMLNDIGTGNTIEPDNADGTAKQVTTEAFEDVQLLKNTVMGTANIKNYQFSTTSPFTSIKSTIQSLKDTYINHKGIQSSNTMGAQPTEEKKLYNAKILKINTELLHRINPMRSENIINNYKSIANDLHYAGNNNPVENEMIDDAVKNMMANGKPVNSNSTMNSVSSPRELEIRSIIGKIKLDAPSLETLTSIIDTPVPQSQNPNNITTTNPGAQKGTGFINVAKEYETKMMDRDIVETFMHLGSLPYGFSVKDIEVTDISSVTSLMYNWKVILDNSKTAKRSTLNIRVPRLINGRFYNNGIWYNIGKQDFPLPILKTNKKTVMFTSNYGKITIERYDSKSLTDILGFVATLKKYNKLDGSNPYFKPGTSVATNDRFPSTVEFDEYAKQWLQFIVRETNCEIYFNRQICLNKYEFVSVKDDEFCCGMINQVPVVININTGLTRNGKSLTDTMLDCLPDDIRNEYNSFKPGKVTMYTQLRVLATNMPLGVVCCAWEGISTVLKKAKTNYQIVDKKFSDPKYFTIPFKDKVLAIEKTIPNQLLFNGFYRISTKSHMFEEFDHPIMEPDSLYVTIFNDLFFKKFSDLTAFVTTYHFFVDVITKDVCNHYNIPDDMVSALIYASNLLADNSKMNESSSTLYRIRSSEILPAIIHYHLALAISRYNNTIGSKTRTNSLVMNPNEVINELVGVNTVNPMSALNPMIELHQREECSTKGFMGLNVDRSYTRERRSANDSMIGKYAMSSPNSANVGINRQLAADPKIESVRGYTSDATADSDLNDLQLASFSELLTPSSVSRDDAIRTAIATSQTGHIVSTEGAEPVLIANGMDEIVASCLSDEFAFVAPEDGKVLEIKDGYMVLQYKSGKKAAVNVSSKYSFNSGSGFYVDNKLLTNKEAGESFKANDILAYHEKYFSKDSDGVVRMNLGPLAKVAIAGSYFTYEDAGLMTVNMSKKLSTKLSMCETIKIDLTDDIDSIVKVGEEVEIGDPLVVFGLGDTGDKSVDNFLKAFQTDSLTTAKRKIVAKHAGTIVDVRIYTNKSLDKLSPSLFKIVSEHFAENKKKRAILDKHDSTNNPYKLDTLYNRPTEPLNTPSIKGITTDVLVEIYIEHGDNVSIGDKVALYGPSKQIVADMCPEGLEPYSEFRPDEEVSMLCPPVTILKRMVPSIVLVAIGNKVLIEAKRKMKEIWES